MPVISWYGKTPMNMRLQTNWQELTNIRVRDNYVGPVNCYSGSITYNENIGGQTVSFRNPLAYHGRFEITLYPHLTYDIRLKREVSTEYAHGVPVTQEKLYTYNSRNQIATCRTSTSRSGYVMESYAYAADVSSYKDEFKANNVLDAVQNYQRTSGGATLYLNNTYGDVFSKFTLQSSEEYSSLYPEKELFLIGMIVNGIRWKLLLPTTCLWSICGAINILCRLPVSKVSLMRK